MHATIRPARVWQVALAALALLSTACDPEDDVLAVLLSVPSPVQTPHLQMVLDSATLRWTAEHFPHFDPGEASLHVWLADPDIAAPASWLHVGRLLVGHDGANSGAFDAPAGVDVATETRPLVVTLEDGELVPPTPSQRAILWTLDFPDALTRHFTYGDAYTRTPLETLLSLDGDHGPVRAFGRFEIYYQTDTAVFRFWNLRGVMPDQALVLWATDRSTYQQLGLIAIVPSLPATSPTSIPAFKATNSELRIEARYDTTHISYASLAEVLVTIERLTPALARSLARPSGPVVAVGATLAHGSLTSGADGHSHH